MSLKRTLDDGTLSSPKKVKVEDTVCHFPFGIQNIVDEITKYLEGQNLYVFRLSCKDAVRVTKERDYNVMITPGNVERTTRTPGYHYLKIDGNGLEVYNAIMNNRYGTFPNLKHLTVDYCRKESGCTNNAYFLREFKFLRSLRIIRCCDVVNLEITANANYLDLIEVYSSGLINFRCLQEIKEAYLCSTMVPSEESKRCIKLIVPQLHPEYVSNVKCHSNNRVIRGWGGQKLSTSDAIREFVPNPDFL